MMEVGRALLDANFWERLLWGALQVAVILLLAWALYGALIRLLRRYERRAAGLSAVDPERQRIYTIVTLLRSLGRYLVGILALLSVLAAIGINIGPILAGAGVAGLAIGFGAQTLVKDVIAGFFLLFERLIAVGDLINLRGEIGVVEEIGLRVTKIRKFNGELLIVPNEELRFFGNRNRDFMRAVVELDVAYEQDVERIMQILNAVATRWAQERAEIVLEPPVVQGILQFGDSGMRLRLSAKVKPGTQFEAELELRRRIREAFAAHNVDIPFPRRMVYVHEQQPDFRIRE
ncbi:MAG: mechanosensitive ion channel family protein [Bacteroidetes bacterium]|nr:mechanosensitive ion channel family protein [Rhodothermia bacterium]MCS7154973.1 mechanosensitive ion channel family protein [Bacteroidota bacterium]MCX7907257.1 mechanosensitive ion channel family protein [Bacteroidota bacterium]MDW8138017.1 mechanosensitive ion channel family protein [Bacteroidota bacterium]MDW8286131.1 mechanosensitive ion channel family protein [Bacteroidota bacterium]